MKELVIARELEKRYGEKTVLSGVSLTLSAGERLCVMAPSGTGKTTLLRLLLGLERPDGGSLFLASRLRWGVVFQEDRLLEEQDAIGNLRFVLGEGMDRSAARRLLEDLGLGEARGKAVKTYSGGMKRRLALARALLAPSDALALDEPFAGLDGESRQRCIAAIRRHGAERGVILVTHDIQDAEALEARVLRLEKTERQA